MPLDGVNFVFSPQDLLEDALLASGLRPIEPRFLDQHKLQQIRRHPASWAYRHRHSIELAQLIVLVAGIVAFFVLFSANRFGWATAAGALAFAAAVLPILVPLKAPARWWERYAPDLDGVPGGIRDAARRLQHQLPDVRFRVGELYQDRIKLDPYLIAEYGGNRIVLGIWDGDEVIACA